MGGILRINRISAMVAQFNDDESLLDTLKDSAIL